MHCGIVLCGILYSCEKEQMITPHNNRDETHRHDIEGGQIGDSTLWTMPLLRS